MILAYTVIMTKSSQDIISGVSKLDDLLVVSVFQRKKKKDEVKRISSASFIPSNSRDSSGKEITRRSAG